MAAAEERGFDIAAVLGTGLAALSIVGGHLFEGGYMYQIVQPTAALIVFGGTVAGILVQFSWEAFIQAGKDTRDILQPPKQDLRETMDTILELAKLARRQGLVAIDREAQKIADPFLQRALRLTADGIEPKALRQALQMQIKNVKSERITSSKIYEAGGGYSPTIGVLGAVMGLIHVMGHLTEPDKLGAGIAVAFVATLYGVGVANLFLLPIAGKLKTLLEKRVKRMELIIEGAAAIAASENPLIVEQKLTTYLPSAEQEAIAAAQAKPADAAA